jgi:hypothetical protein
VITPLFAVSVMKAMPASGIDLSTILGFGKDTTGAGASPAETFTVTNSATTGTGTWEDIMQQQSGNCLIRFAIPSCNVFFNRQLGNNVTVDGLINGQNGVTLNQPDTDKRAVFFGSNNLIRGIRFVNAEDRYGQGTAEDLSNFDGDPTARTDLVVDRCTFIGATDGACDLVSNVSDITIQRCLFYGHGLSMLCKYDTRSNITIHRCIFTENGERNPQMKGTLGPFEYINNVVSFNTKTFGGALTPYGLKVWCGGSGSDSPGAPSGNVRGCYFYSDDAFVFEVDAGASQPDVYNNGNSFAGGAISPGSPRGTPVTITSGYEVNPLSASQLKTLVADVCGAPNRTARDQEVIDDVKAILP